VDNTYNASLQQGVLDYGLKRLGILHTELHGILVVVDGVVDTAHHTLIITEEENGQASDAVDGDEELPLLQFVHHVPSWNDIHD